MAKITPKTYFHPDVNRDFMSVSQFKSFMKCEAEALAELNMEFERQETTALLVGSYVDAYFSAELDEFSFEHPQIFKKDGTLKAEFKQAEEIIQRIERDDMMMDYLSGDTQVILTGKLYGYDWKIKVDSLHDDKIVDLKVMRDFEDVYVPGEGKQPFIEAWGYDIQGAIYQQIIAQNNGGELLPFYIVGATKERVPDIGIFEVPQHKLDVALKIVLHNIDRIADVKAGLEKPNRCEHCDYCKNTKKITRAIDYTEEI